MNTDMRTKVLVWFWYLESMWCTNETKKATRCVYAAPINMNKMLESVGCTNETKKAIYKMCSVLINMEYKHLMEFMSRIRMIIITIH